MFIAPVFPVYEALTENRRLLDIYEDIAPLIIDENISFEDQDYIEWPTDLSEEEYGILTDKQYMDYQEFTDYMLEELEKLNVDVEPEQEDTFILIQNY